MRLPSPSGYLLLSRAALTKSVGFLDVGLLRGQELADLAGQVLFQGILVGLLGGVFALFGSFKQGVIAAAELGFQVAPGAMESAR